jgi:hypothetical protein
MILCLAQFHNNHRWKGCNYRVAPGMRLDLNASYFKNKIIEASALSVIGMFLKNTLEGCI